MIYVLGLTELPAACSGAPRTPSREVTKEKRMLKSMLVVEVDDVVRIVLL